MTVKINKFNNTPNADNPPNINIFKHEWQLAQWYVHRTGGLWVADLISKSKTAVDGSPIDMDIAITCPVFMLKHVSHHSGFGTVKFKQLSPETMLNQWKWQQRMNKSQNEELDVPMDKQDNNENSNQEKIQA